VKAALLLEDIVQGDDVPVVGGRRWVDIVSSRGLHEFIDKGSVDVEGCLFLALMNCFVESLVDSDTKAVNTAIKA
jgi:hypothetical protein